MSKVCVLVVSHNYPEITDRLCDKIVETTKNVDYDLHVIETGSDLAKLSKYTTLWVKDGCRMTRGFNLLKNYADAVNKYKNKHNLKLNFSSSFLFNNSFFSILCKFNFFF